MGGLWGEGRGGIEGRWKSLMVCIYGDWIWRKGTVKGGMYDRLFDMGGVHRTGL